MIRKSRKNPKITQFIIDHIEDHPNDIATFTAKQFNVSRVTANHYLHDLVAKNVLSHTGSTRARSYKLKNIIDETFSFPVIENMQEDVIWREKLLPFFEDVGKNIRDICYFGITEMLNNVFDHSESKYFCIDIQKNVRRVLITIYDFGIGIFEKIRKVYNLDDARHALLELSKGKLTTDPKHHTGQGVFFTSRMFNRFCILSGSLYYGRSMKDDDEFLITVEDRKKEEGTTIQLEINLDAKHTARDIFKKYEDDDYGFSRTHVPVKLARYGDEQLVSRSQAKRILAHFEKFAEVFLDFEGVSEIGQAFADEIFRVYKNAHPGVNIIAVGTNPEIDRMIKHAQVNK